MKTNQLFERLWEHGRTLKRVGLVLVMCLMAIPQLWATSGIKLRGDYVGGFSYTSDTWTKGVNDDETKRYWDVYHSGGSKFWRIWLVYYNHDGGPDNENEDYDLNEGTPAYMVVNKNKHSFVTTADPGILRIKVDQYGSDKGRSKDEYPYVWVERPAVEFKYPWDGTNWTKVTATDNHDGTYTCEGTYRGVNRFNAGPNGADKIAPEGSGEGTTEIIGGPTSGQRCQFKWQPGTGDPNTDYKYTGGEEDNRGRFTITKLCTITYYANGGTGDAPDPQEVLYGADQTLRGNTGSLAKTDYVFVGWNTANDGSGDHYDVGATLEDVEADVDLYAEWVSGKWGVKGKGGDGALGSDFETFHVLRKISTNKYKGSVSLGAHQVYEFKITDNTTWYGKADINRYFLGQTNSVTLATGGGAETNCIIATGNAGDYTFEFNDKTAGLIVTYPNGNNHPSTNFVYYSNPSGWGTVKAYIYNNPELTTWANSPILGTPVTIGGNTYYYTALGDRNDVIFQNGSGGQTADLNEADTEVGHYYNDSWAQFTVRITLNNQSATSAGTEYKEVKFYYDELTTSIICPTKTGYNFGGYYTETNGGGVQIINASGVWQASVSGYTDGDKKWIKDGGTATLYAKWTEKTWNVTAQVSPAGTGYANPSSATSYGEVTGGAITASNNTGYHFTGWSITSGSGSFTSAATIASNTFKPTSATTLTATFVANTYDLDLDSEGGSSGSSSVTVTYNSSSHTAITNPTKTGYTFGGWYDGDDGTGNLVINTSGVLQENVGDLTGDDGIWIKDGTPTLYAKWTEDEYNVTAVASPTGAGTVTPSSATSYGQITGGAITATDGTGYDFSKWVVASGAGTIGSATTASTTFKPTEESTVKAIFCPESASGLTVYKFEVKSNVSDGNICSGVNQDPVMLNTTTHLTSLEGGTLGAKIAASGNVNNLAFKNGNIRYANGSYGVLILSLDCSLKTGDVIRYVNSNSGSVAIHTAQGNSTNEIVLNGNSKTTVQSVVVTSAFNGLTTVYIERKANTSDIPYIEIIRPYVVTLNASENGGKVNGKNTEPHYMLDGETLTLPHATNADDPFFKGWYTTSDGNTKVSNPYTPTGSTTLYAQFEDCPDEGTVYKFQVKTGLANGSITAGDLNVGNYLSTMDGGTAVITGTHAQIVSNNAIDFKDNGDYITVDLDCALQTGDTIITTISGTNSGIKITSTSSTTSLQNISYGTNVKTIVPSGLNNYKTFRIYRQNSDAGGISYFEIRRPTPCTEITPTWSTDYSSTTLNVGATSSTPAVGKDGSSGALSFSSSDDAIATVNSSGVVTAVKTGSVTITATVAADGTKNYCEGTVTKEFTIKAGVTYNANGAGDGEVPTDANKYTTNDDVTIAGNTGSLEKEDYIFVGWNTASDGTGTHYDVGATMKMPNKSAGVTLYAEWVQYASSINIEDFICDKSPTSDQKAAFLSNNHYIATAFGSTAYECNSTSGKEGFKGLKMKDNGFTLTFYVASGKNVTFGFGRISSNSSAPNFTIKKNGTTQDLPSYSGEGKIWTLDSDASYKQEVTYTTSAFSKFELKTSNGSTTTLMYVLIEGGCSEDPTVTAGGNSSVAVNTATVTCASGISSFGSGCEIESYGFVIATTTDPEIDGVGVTTHEVGTTYETEDVSFSKDLTGLTAGTTYYVRPYATNGNGTAYGTQTYFTTHYAITTGSHTNGSVTIPSSAAPSTTVNISATPNTGYHFTSWDVYQTGSSSTKVTLADDDDEDGKTRSFTMPSYAVTVDASFTINSWTLTWNFDGGSSSETAGEDYTSGSTNYGVTIDYPGNGTMSKTGHSFTGWSSSATTMPDNDLTITALWSANNYNVADHTLSNATLTDGGATGTNKATYGTNYTATFAANTGYNLPSDVTVQIGGVTKTKDTHYTWNSSTGELSINGSAILGNIAITVAGVAKTYTLTLDKNGGNANGEAVATYNSHTLASITDATCTNLTHYSLDGYYTAADGGVLIVYGSGSPRNLSAEDASHDDELEDWLSPYTDRNWIKDDDDVTLYAHWRLYITLNHNADHHGTGSYGSATAIYNGSALKTISHTTGESGYSLLGYYTTADGGTKILNADGSFASTNITDYISGGKWIYNGESYVTLYAHWGKEFDVTYNGNGNTSGTAPSAVEDQIFGTEITVATKGDLAKTGYSFVGWNTASDGSGTFYAAGSKFTLTDDITLYAQWGTSGDCTTSDFVIRKGSDTEYQGCMESSSYNGTATSFTAGSATTVGNAKMTISSYSDNAIKRPGEGNTFSIVIEPVSGYYLSSICWAGKVENDETVSYYWDNNSGSATTITPTTTSGTGVTYDAPNSTTTKFTASYVDDGDKSGGIWWRNVQVEVCPTGSYTVSFDDMADFEGESTLPSNITGVPSGSKIAEPVIPSATGYVFGGWYKEGACSNAWDFDTDEVTAATTLYAKWVNVSGTYTFHYGGGEPTDNTWVIIPFTSDGTNYRKIENFVVPNATKYPSFFVGYEGAYDTENAKSTVYDWDDTYGYSNDGRMPIKHEGTRLNSQSNCPIAGNGNTAEGVKGKLRISVSGTITTNCNVGFYPNGFGLTWNRETTALHATPSPEVFETDVVTLTAAEAAGNFEVKLATEDSYAAYSRTATETAEGQLNGRKVEGEDYDIAAGTVGRFQINLSKKEDNYGLRFVPLINRTTASQNWESDNDWTLWRRPTIDETAYVAHYTTVYSQDAHAKNIIVDKTSGAGYPKVSLASGSSGVGGLLVAQHIQVLKMVDDDPTLSNDITYSELDINSSAYGSAALIMGDASTTTAAYTALYTKAVRYDGNWMNQYIGTPVANGSIYDFYGSYLYVFNPSTGGWAQANKQASSAMPPFKAYNLMRQEGSPGIYSFYDPLNFPGITDGKLKELTCDDENDATEPEDNRVGAYMFANSWTAPIDVKAMETTDFVGAEATIYIFNAGSPKQYDEAEGGDPTKTEEPGQWVSLPVKALSYVGMPLTVIPSMQAFRINTTAATASLTLDYKKHVYEPAADRAEGIEIKPMRAPKRTDERPNVLQLFVNAESGYKDNMYILEREDFTDAFDNGWDGRKIFGSGTAPQIFGVNGTNKLSIDAIQDMEGQVIGFKTGTADNEYTVTFNYEGDDVWYFNDTKDQEATLISNDAEYTFTTQPGENSNRFYISASPIQKVPTDIENAVSDPQNTKARKLIINDHVYIIRNGRMYSVDGAVVK